MFGASAVDILKAYSNRKYTGKERLFQSSINICLQVLILRKGLPFQYNYFNVNIER